MEMEIRILNIFERCPYIIQMINYSCGNSSNQNDSNSTDGIKIALEFMNGGSLKDFISDKNQINASNNNKHDNDNNNSMHAHKHSGLSESQVHIIGNNICCALRQLHNENYVHNDIKPANILLSKDGDCKLTDFGTIIKVGNINEKITKQIGSVKYFSPEKFDLDNVNNINDYSNNNNNNGKNNENESSCGYNSKADIWALGVTLYECMIGKMLDDDNMNVNYQLYNETCINWDQLSQHYSKHCCDFVQKCLILNQNERWTTDELLKHPFLNDKCCNESKNNNKQVSFGNIEANFDNLGFIIESLIDYYSKKSFINEIMERRANVNNASSGSLTDPLPIAGAWNVNKGDVNQSLKIEKFSEISQSNSGFSSRCWSKSARSIGKNKKITDKQKILNISKATGLPVDQVRLYMYQSVLKFKNKYKKY